MHFASASRINGMHISDIRKLVGNGVSEITKKTKYEPES